MVQTMFKIAINMGRSFNRQVKEWRRFQTRYHHKSNCVSEINLYTKPSWHVVSMRSL